MEHDGWKCTACGSTDVQFLHSKPKDCSHCEDVNENGLCNTRVCCEDYCDGDVEWIPSLA